MKKRPVLSVLPVAVLSVLTVASVAPEAQFRRGMFGEAREIRLFPIEPPLLLLPAGRVEITGRNSSSASARIADRLRERLEGQLTGNDSRLQAVAQGGDLTITATLTEWTQSRRNSTKYVSERRQVGTKEVIDKNGKKKTEPVYEHGTNKPSVVISAAAGIRVEVRSRTGATLADETARHTISEEHLTSENPPSREAVEDTLLDAVVQKASARISPGRVPIVVLLSRSDEVDKLNAIALERRWNDWLNALDTVKPHRDRKKDAYRLHNLAVAHEALAYDAATPEETLSQLAKASSLIAQAATAHADEKYIVESRDRIGRSVAAYQRLAQLYALAGSAPAAAPAAPSHDSRPRPSAGSAKSATPAEPAPAAPLTNKDVIDLRAAGLDDDNLIASINDAKTVSFDLSPAGLKALLNAKVTNRVINAMRAKAKQ